MEKPALHRQTSSSVSSNSLIQLWRPATFQRSVLICTTIATSLLFGVTVLLHFIDLRYKTIFPATEGDGLSNSQLFLIQYLPIILLVIYGTWISMLDLDIKRLEPWYRLSSRSRKLEESPLLCRYDTNFVLSVLVSSVRKRHWIIFSSSLLAIMATVIVPAVQSSMLTIRKQDVQRPLLLSDAGNLVDVNLQKFQMTSRFLLSAYATVWFGQTAPAFTTNEYALAPFSLDISTANTGGDSSNATITGSTQRFWSELSCWLPASTTINSSSNSVSFDDGLGCEAKDLLSFNASTTNFYDPPDAKYEAYQYGISGLGTNPFLPTLSAECPNKPHLILATWRTAGPSTPDFGAGGNATAIFCEPAYYHEPVDAIVKASDLSVISYTPTGPKIQFADNNFNRTHFEYMISYGAPPWEMRFDNMTQIVDIVDATYVGTPPPGALNISFTTPSFQSSATMILFALGVTQLPGNAYLDANTLYTAYSRAHQLLFAHAARQLLGTNSTNPMSSVQNGTLPVPTNQSGMLTVRQEAARLVPGFAFATEILLILISALCLYLVLMLPGRQLRLSRNPDSLAETMMLSRSSETQEFFARMSLASEQVLERRFQHSQFHIHCDEDGPLLLSESTEEVSMEDNHIDTSTDLSSLPVQSLKHTPEFSWTVIGLISCLLLSSVVLLTILSVLIWSRDGLQVFASSEITQQFVLNFLPTAAATLLGLYLVLLCRVYSFIKPIHDLFYGHATARNTLLVNYTSLPPQLLFTKALRSRHYLLATLSVAALLSNVLTVTTASLFIMQEKDHQLSIDLTPVFDAVVIDHMNASLAALGELSGDQLGDPVLPNVLNISDNIPLPSWTTTEYGFLPVNLTSDARLRTSSYNIEALGYGADLKCTNLLGSSPDISGNIAFQNNGTMFKVWANFTQPDNNTVACVYDLEAFQDVDRLNLANLSTTVSALEIDTYMGRWNGSMSLIDGFCGTHVIKGWLRAKIANSLTRTQNSDIDYNATIIVCEPRLNTRRFSLSTSASGDILTSKAIGPANYDLPQSVNLSSTLLQAVNAMRGSNNIPQWHNDTVAVDWSNYLFKELNGNRNWLNASMPPPTAEEASPVVSQVFSRLFAVQLFFDRNKLQPAGSANTSSTLRARDDSQNTTDNSIQGNAIIPVQKLFVSRPNFIISITIIIFDLIVLIVFRLSLPKPFLPRMPFTIASQIAFFSGSHVIDDVVKAGGDLKKLDEQGYRYAYGRYIGKDGWLHTGIEREQFVTKL